MYSRQELEAAGLLDFRQFLRLVWAFLGLPEPTPVQLSIGYYLQHGPRRRIIQAFRGVGKSWITVAYVAWRLLLDPQIKIMVVSASEPLAGDFSKFLKQLIGGMPILQHLAPKKGQLDRGDKFDVGPALPSKDPSVKSVGITGQLTGSRADVIVADDVEIPKNSYTHLLRERLAELVKEFDALLKPVSAATVIDPEITYLGTPQIEASLYSRLRTRGYDVRIWPAEVPSSVTKYGGKLAPYVLKLMQNGAKAGDPTEPLRFTREDLALRKASYGLAGYALQFMLDTSPSELDRHPLKLGDCLVTDVDPEQACVKYEWSRDKDYTLNVLPCGGFDGDTWRRPFWRSDERSKFMGRVMAIDPSGRGKDETAYAIVYQLHGQLFLVDSSGYVDGYGEDTLRAIAAAVVRHRVGTLVIEENYGGGMFTQLLTPIVVSACKAANVPPPRINPEEEWDGWSRGQKELRIADTLQPIFENHRLIIDQRVIQQDAMIQQERPVYSLMYQVTRLTREKGCLAHDDRVEALSMACSFFMAKMNRDRDNAIQRHRDEAFKKEVRTFFKHVLMKPPKMLRLKYAGRK